MNTIDETTDRELHPARTTVTPINFYCHAPQARAVQLAGDFNHWHPLPMLPRDDGWRFIQLLLVRGHHQYRFLVDGKPMLDPRAMGKGRNQLGEEVSLVAVG